MKIGVLTSSRADYGIHVPLLCKLKSDEYFNLEIIAFGAHLSIIHGFSISDVERDGYRIIHRISSLISNDDEQSIASSYGLTVIKFSHFWALNYYDLVICLGDRFEMSAAVQAGIPFGVKFAHLHGGETTLGAIDNIYRHQISLASELHFTATEEYSEKVIQLVGSSNNVYTVGSLSLDGIEQFNPVERQFLLSRFNVPNDDFALVTFHPETVDTSENRNFAFEMRSALSQIVTELSLVITMPNADTMGSVFRSEIEKLKLEFPEKVVCVENFGKENYFSAMHYSKILIGNTSSGILEAASFGKYVINVGNRQQGRVQSANCINVQFKATEILNGFRSALILDKYFGENVYYRSSPSDHIIIKLKDFYETV
jgi:GDP/UDP-N,N'-diacetylbacillosamine 2-epimerase (hydrolysing)